MPADSNEHVWPQWLRQYPAYDELVRASKSGDLPAAEFPDLTKDEQGRFQLSTSPRGRTPILPEVQVKVCSECNTGWMSGLEKRVIPTLDSWITGKKATLKRGQVETLASWVTKTALMYALYYRPKDSPFRSADYAEFFQTKRPFKKSIIWVAFSDAPNAFVSAYLEPFWIQGAEEESVDPDRPPTAASFMLGAHGVVFLARFWMNMPIKYDNALIWALTKYYYWNLPRKMTADLQRIEPPRRRVRGPGMKISFETLEMLRNAASDLMEAGGLPLEGLTEEEVAEVRKRWREGSDAAQLRQEFPQKDGDE